MRIVHFLVIAVIVIWQNQSAAGGDPWRDDPGLLPQYCKDRVKGLSSPQFSKWRSSFGDVYVHIHHYCSGLYAEQKAKGSFNQQERKGWLQGVVQEMQYVATRGCTTGCVLYPELHTRWGWALGELSQQGEAVKHFMLAIQAKPEYVQAYAKLSDMYLETGQPEEARKILKDGLKAKPGSRMLQRRLEKIKTSP